MILEILEPCVDLRYLCFEGAAATTAAAPLQPIPQGQEEKKEGEREREREQISMWVSTLRSAECVKQGHLSESLQRCMKTICSDLRIL